MEKISTTKHSVDVNFVIQEAIHARIVFDDIVNACDSMRKCSVMYVLRTNMIMKSNVGNRLRASCLADSEKQD